MMEGRAEEMSNRTHVCLGCKKSYRRDKSVRRLVCPVCKQPCEYVHWKIHIPSPKREKEWDEFWRKYKQEKRLIEQFRKDPRVKRVHLELLNQTLVKR